MKVNILVVMATSFGLTMVGAAADPRERIITNWDANRNRFKTVRYRLSGTIDMKDPTAGGKVEQRKSAPGPGVKTISALITMDIPKKRFRIESSRPVPSLHDRTKWVYDHKITAYNGKALQTFVPRSKNERPEGDPDLAISTGDLGQLLVEATYWPVFAAHGFIPTRTQPLHPDRLPTEYDLDDFQYQGTGILAGRKCEILRTPPFLNGWVELWADPERGSVIQKRIDYSHKTNPWYRFEVEHQLNEGGWIPKHWTISYSMSHRVMQVERIDVVEFQLNQQISDGDFTIPITSGLIVEEFKYPPRGVGLDAQRPATKTSTVDASGRMKVIEETGFTTIDGVQLPPERPWFAKWWWECVSALGVFLILATLLYRRFALKT